MIQRVLSERNTSSICWCQHVQLGMTQLYEPARPNSETHDTRHIVSWFRLDYDIKFPDQNTVAACKTSSPFCGPYAQSYAKKDSANTFQSLDVGLCS